MRSARQARFLDAAEHSPGFAAKVGFKEAPASFGGIRAPAAPSPVGAVAPITMPGGAVQSGGYLANTKFTKPAMPGLRKVRI